jgi:MFS family permease
MGFGLLILRLGVSESGMFETVKKDQAVVRGNFFQLFTKATRTKRYLALILSGVPIWYVVGILVVRSPAIGKEMGIAEPVISGTAVMMAYIGLAVGDLTSGLLSQLLKSRKRAVAVYLLITAIGVVLYFTVGRTSTTAIYAACFVLGVGAGYWAVFVTMASEQFGTNIRSTVTTTAPNFVRGSVPVLAFAYTSLHGSGQTLERSAQVVGVVVLVVALVALLSLDESYGKDLEFVEKE